MRNEHEMLSMILAIASENDLIRMVELNGSRVDGQRTKDPFQDYDIVYYVETLQPFLADHSWLDCFGERIMMQMPDSMLVPPSAKKRESFAYLMLFTDGNRIDLTLTPVSLIPESMAKEEPRRILLDKDDRLSSIKVNTGNPYRLRAPGQQAFFDCANEFWWVSTYVAKALWRHELPLAKEMMDGPVRKMLMLMLTWHIGIESNFTADPGKSGRNIEQYVESEMWNKLLLTYPDGKYEQIWTSLFATGALFEELTDRIAESLQFERPTYGKDITAYLKQIEQLPKDSESIYPSGKQ